MLWELLMLGMFLVIGLKSLEAFLPPRWPGEGYPED